MLRARFYLLSRKNCLIDKMHEVTCFQYYFFMPLSALYMYVSFPSLSLAVFICFWIGTGGRWMERGMTRSQKARFLINTAAYVCIQIALEVMRRLSKVVNFLHFLHRLKTHKRHRYQFKHLWMSVLNQWPKTSSITALVLIPYTVVWVDCRCYSYNLVKT